MDKNLHNIEDLFRKGLEDNEEMPPENTWDRIDKILDKDKIISIYKKYARLKWVAFLLLFFLVGVGMYFWNYRKNNSPEKKENVIINKETQSKNNNVDLSNGRNNINLKKQVDLINASVDNVLKKEVKPKSNNEAPSYGDSHDNLKKPVDSINTIAYNNQNKVKEIGPTKIDETIVKKQPEEKLANSSITKKLSNSSFSNRKKDKENKPNNEFDIKRSTHNEYDLDVVANSNNLNSNKDLLPLIQLHFFPITEVKNSTTDLIEFKKNINSIAFPEANASVKKSKRISKNKFLKLKTQSPFSITGYYSRDISFFYLQDDPSGNPNRNGIADENDEKKTPAFTMGALIDFKTSRHWSLQSGLTLSTTHIHIKFEDERLYAKADNSGNVKYRVNTVLGYGYILPSFSNNPNVGDSISSRSTKSSLQYLRIPLAVKYSLGNGKFSVNVMAGLSGNFLTQGKIEAEVEQGNDNETETTNKIHGLKSTYFSGLAGIGLDYNFYKNLSVSFSPTIRFALNSINSNLYVQSFPNSVGFVLGLNIKL